MDTTRASKRLLVGLLLLASAGAAPASDTCGGSERLHALDFWLGRWKVSSEGAAVGKNRIEPILVGCAVTERWEDARGQAGFSLFWFDRHADRWKQVWVTDRALRSGGTKEKVEVPELSTESRIRFEGRYPGQEPGTTIVDRTTLTREPDGSVRQLIEVSSDDGRSWKTSFDGHYRRRD